MSLTPGTRLGPYEILAPLGAGGMGEVYRARDSKLDRGIAVKILPPDVAGDPERRQRFEQEARAASSLNHPSIVHIYDIGSADFGLYIAMELVEGRSLREVLAPGPLPVRKLLDLAIEIADGLAKAHAAGIVHRDLKPENVVVTSDGHVKILDFGLAKLTEPRRVADPTEGTTAAKFQTRSGQIMGTAAYMSPEQAAGQAVDFRSDQFSFGVLLYEMASGRRAFQGKSTPETLAAIIRDQPETLSGASPAVPSVLRWLIEERCLAKDPQERYASTRDLLRDLRSVRDHLSEASGPGLPATAVARSRAKRAAVLLAALAATAGASLVGYRTGLEARPPAPASPTFHPLTFRSGTIWSARFAPDGQTILYGMASEGRPVELFLTRPESPESRPLGFPQTDILAISRSGEVAISLERRYVGGWIFAGTLARVPIVGGAPRQILEDVAQADWGPDGESLAVVRGLDANVLEFPIGRLLYRTAGWISDPRVSPKGDLVAFFDHPSQGDTRGSVGVVDLAGKKRSLSREWASTGGLAWSPEGDAVWFTGAETGNNGALWAASLMGSERLLLRSPGALVVHDVSRDGGVLLTRETQRTGIIGLPPGEAKERDLSWLDWSVLADHSADGKTILIDEEGQGSSPDYTVYVRKTDGSPAVRLGEGAAHAISPDGKWVVSVVPSSPTQLVLLPTGPGTPKRLPPTGLRYQNGASWLPDGKRVLYNASEEGRGVRVYVQDLQGGKPRPVTPEGVSIPLAFHPVSPDGRFIAAIGTDQQAYLYPVDAGEPQALRGLEAGETPIRFGADGRFLYVFRRGAPPLKVFRVDVVTGRRELWREITPEGAAGITSIPRLCVTPDGSSYSYNYRRILSELYLVEGLR